MILKNLTNVVDNNRFQCFNILKLCYVISDNG